MIITIDGPSGSGKSTVARNLAKKLGFIHLNQGAFFRAIGLMAEAQGMALDDDARLAHLARETKFAFQPAERGAGLLVDGKEVGPEVGTPRAGRLASTIAVLPKLREAILESQRGAVSGQSVVVEGRDAGSVGFPEAELKVFLDAGLAVRARRRFKELQEQGSLGGSSYEQVYAEMAERDSRDSSREVAPLVQPEGAMVIDTSEASVDEVVGQIAAAAVAFNINNEPT